MEEKVFELVVVGAGMMGSSAAFHASRLPNTSVCLVGPAEPKTRQDADIFGCWHDEGRIYFRGGNFHLETWTTLSFKSNERYRGLEKLTGMNIFHEVGFVTAHLDKNILQKQQDHASQHGIEGEDISSSWKNTFPFLNLFEGACVYHEKRRAGYLNPRKLVEAYQAGSLKAGAKVLHEVVSAILPSKARTHRWEVATENGTVLRCQSVLVAIGSYTAFKPLFQHVMPNMVPKLELKTQTVAFLQIPEEEAQRLCEMPSMVIKWPFQNLDGAYILPPIKYPDGKWYLKLGHRKAYEETRSSEAEVKEWYLQQSGKPECVQELAQFMRFILPGLKVKAVSGGSCITTSTPNSEPFIDMVAEGFGVAVGGNGHAAKSCDEIGRLAAHLTLLGEWESDIPQERLKVVWQPEV